MPLALINKFRDVIRGGHKSPPADVNGASLEMEGANVLGHHSKIRGEVSMGYGTTLGGYNQIMGGSIRFGRYCQIAPFAAVYAINHPLNYITTYVNSRLLGGELKDLQATSTVEVGNDVWIGHGAILLPGVSLGNGVIVGAGAVVTKDVPAYTVVGGNPARVLRPRFSEAIVDILQRLKWWDLRPDQLESVRDLFQIDLTKNEEQAIAKIRAAISRLGLSVPQDDAFAVGTVS
jgi:acetyltransferase-like isoleucine patch superfamily enzyme